MRRHARHGASDRIWMLSPAVATALFFAFKLALGSAKSPWPDEPRLVRAGAQTPSEASSTVRVVSQLRRADALSRPRHTIPDTEAGLMRLLEQEGAVTFLAGEVDVVATPSREFEPTSIEVPAEPTQN